MIMVKEWQAKKVKLAELIPWPRNPRKCRMMEISPDYCSVILQRAKDAFGIVGKRINKNNGI